MNYIDETVQIFGEYVNALCDYRDVLRNGTQKKLEYDYYLFKDVSDGGVIYNYSYYGVEFGSIDMAAFARLADYLCNENLTSIADRFKASLNKMIPVSVSCNLGENMNEASVGISYRTMENYGEVFANNYPLLSFNRATHWSRFFKGNIYNDVSLVNGNYVEKDIWRFSYEVTDCSGMSFLDSILFETRAEVYFNEEIENYIEKNGVDLLIDKISYRAVSAYLYSIAETVLERLSEDISSSLFDSVSADSIIEMKFVAHSQEQGLVITMYGCITCDDLFE